MSRAANHWLMSQCAAVARAVTELSDLGCVVLDVRLGGAAPVICIEPGAATEALDGAMYMRGRIGHRVVATYVARVGKCQVRWPADVPTPPPSNVVRLRAGVAA